jgi:hypothetical protein
MMATIDDGVDLASHFLDHSTRAAAVLPDGVRPEHVRLTIERCLVDGRSVSIDQVSLYWLSVRTEATAEGVIHMPLLVDSTSGALYQPLIVQYEPVAADRWHCELWTGYDFAQPHLLALVEAINTRHGAALVVDQDGVAGQPMAAEGEAAENAVYRYEQRALIFKAIKDANPGWTMPMVATEAMRAHGDRLREMEVYAVSQDTVSNDYRMMGWEWRRGGRTR